MTKPVEERLRHCRAEVNRLNARVIELKSSWSYRIAAPIRLVERAVVSLRKRSLKDNLARAYRDAMERISPNPDKPPAAYKEWIDEIEKLADRDVSQIHRHIASFGSVPPFSIIILPGRGSAKATWASLDAQLYRGFEVISTKPALSSIDRGVKVKVIGKKVAKPQAEIFNAALAEAEGDYCLALEAGDVLSRQALYRYAHAINENPAAKLIYADEDELSSFNERIRPFLKPSWNPQLAFAMDYVGRSALFRTACLRAVNGASVAAGEAWRWDLLLRVMEGEKASAKAARIPFVALHRRKGDVRPRPAELADGVSVVSGALARRNVAATITIDHRGWLAVEPRAPNPPPHVSIIIPTRDRLDLLKRCIDSLLAKPGYSNFDVTIVDNQSRETETIDYFDSLKGHPQVSVMAWSKPFNFAAMHNEVIPQTRGEIIALLNNDTEVIAADWLERMVAYATQPDIGVVGAKLYYPDDKTQHAGIELGHRRYPKHAFSLRGRTDIGPHGVLAVSRDVTAVTGACMVLRRSVFNECGGFDEQFSSDLNDIDLCLKAGVHGYRVTLAADAELYHRESATRNELRGSAEFTTTVKQEYAAFYDRWQQDEAHDPHIIPDPTDPLFPANLTASGRKRRPWLDADIAPEEQSAGVAIYGLFTSEIGIGQAARGVAGALSTTSIPFSCHNYPLSAAGNSIAYPCAKEWHSNFHQHLFIINPIELLHVKDDLPEGHRIGFWHWELPVFPAMWAPAFDFVDEIWAPSGFVAKSIICATKTPVAVVPHAVVGSQIEKRTARALVHLPQDAFVFLFVFDARSYIERKNPAAVIRAYLDAFPKGSTEQTILVIKCHGPSEEIKRIIRSVGGDKRILVIHQVFSPPQMTALTAAADAFVSLHRAEGFGLNIAEAMASGRLAIATDFSGNTDFMNAENSLLIPYQMRAVAAAEYIYGTGQWWAEPNHDAAVEALRTAARNETLTERLAERARRDMSERYSPQVIGRRLEAALGFHENL